VALDIDGVLYLQVVDPYKASYGVEQWQQAMINLAQTTMRSEIGRLPLDSLFAEREVLNEKIVTAIEKESREWGVHSIRYEIKDIEPPEAVSKAMELQAVAERKKRANILESEGSRVANVNQADADKQAQVLEAEGKATATILKAEAQAKALSQIEEALQQEGGRDAAQFVLGQRYIEAYKKLGRQENTLIMPS